MKGGGLGRNELTAGAARRPFEKTKLCKIHLNSPPPCPRGENCTYAHSEAELRPILNGSEGVSLFCTCFTNILEETL